MQVERDNEEAGMAHGLQKESRLPHRPLGGTQRRRKMKIKKEAEMKVNSLPARSRKGREIRE